MQQSIAYAISISVLCSTGNKLYSQMELNCLKGDQVMKATKKIIKKLMKANDNCTKYRVAKLFGVSHQTVANWDKRGTIMTDEVGLKAAELLGYSAKEKSAFILDLQLDRVSGTTSEPAWRLIRRNLESVAAMILVSVFALPPL